MRLKLNIYTDIYLDIYLYVYMHFVSIECVSIQTHSTGENDAIRQNALEIYIYLFVCLPGCEIIYTPRKVFKNDSIADKVSEIYTHNFLI